MKIADIQANIQAGEKALENPFISKELEAAIIVDLRKLDAQLVRMTTYRTRSGFRAARQDA